GGRASLRWAGADVSRRWRFPRPDLQTGSRGPGPGFVGRLLELFPGAPLTGPLVNRHFTRYESMYSTRPSEQVRGLFERWSIKFSADYYEAKDREEGRNSPH